MKLVLDKKGVLHDVEGSCDAKGTKFDSGQDALKAQNEETNDGVESPKSIKHFCDKCLPNASWETVLG